MFVRHDVHDTLDVHLVHRHLDLEVDVMMIDTNVAGFSACWNKLIKMIDVDLTSIHGHIFKLVDDEHFVVYEFEKGVVNNLSPCSVDFFVEFARYLLAEGLQDIIELQIRDESADDMIEFDLIDYGTVMIKKRDTQHDAIFFTKGWIFHCVEGIVSYKGNESHGATTKGTHQVLVDGKIDPMDRNMACLRLILKENDIIN
jgi:hypothetical protein